MRTSLDFTPFYRSSIGFDRMFNLLENASRVSTVSGSPAYDIVRAGEDAYRIVLAVPGFSMNDLEISQEPNLLLITGKAGERSEEGYLHRGIDNRGFTQRFELADYVEVVGAHLADGLLTIELKRELPDAMKPRRIQIAGPVAQEQRQIESEARKAA
jgi:molecular chaperone IbpA